MNRFYSEHFSENDLQKIQSGKHYKLFQKLGAQKGQFKGQKGVYFSVWAPEAEKVSIIGDFNGWSGQKNSLQPVESTGIWCTFVPNLNEYSSYKYKIQGKNGFKADKADPCGFFHQLPPSNQSLYVDLDKYQWKDSQWMAKRKDFNSLNAPISIYEMHLGSWQKNPDDSFKSYQELTDELVPYLKKMNFTHVEFMPIMEFPFDGSWGYQCTGYFAPSSRFGNPFDLMGLIDELHQNGIGVILDWVPSHFPEDEHGLGKFDGSSLYEHADPRKGFHPDWKSLIFNYGRNEVQDFLISNALFWLDRYHVDGLRVDAVASMLYLDYSRKDGEWIPNHHGGRENYEAMDFLKKLNCEVYKNFPDALTIAEESTAWPNVSRPVDWGGLGFGMKWDMGWMHDSLKYMDRDPLYRHHHHNEISFRMVYAFNENFCLPLSHDEVVHGKKSLLSKMPGDEFQRFANLRCLYGLMFGMPGKKLLFMGSELAEYDEWSHEEGLHWELLDFIPHQNIKKFVGDLNLLYRKQKALHLKDFSSEGFRWIKLDDHKNSVFAFVRQGKRKDQKILVVLNFTPEPKYNYQLELEDNNSWKLLLNSDDKKYFGSGMVVHQSLSPKANQNPQNYLDLEIPPLSVMFYKYKR